MLRGSRAADDGHGAQGHDGLHEEGGEDQPGGNPGDELHFHGKTPEANAPTKRLAVVQILLFVAMRSRQRTHRARWADCTIMPPQRRRAATSSPAGQAEWSIT
jgi:hypothetical protein